MKRLPIYARFRRSISLVEMVLFVALSLIASGPHAHDLVHGPAGQGIVHTSAEHEGACPLCDWQMHSAAIVASSPPPALAATHSIRIFLTAATQAASSTLSRPVGRGPPHSFTHTS